MASGGVQVTGLAQAVRALKAMGAEVDDLKEAMSAIADEGAERAARHAPIRSGRLAQSVRGNRAQSKAVIRAGRSSVPYAGPINYGWPARNIRPSGFMQKADEEMKPRSLVLLETNINQIIRRKGLS